MSVKVVLLVCCVLVSACLVTSVKLTSPRNHLRSLLTEEQSKGHVHLEMSDAVEKVSTLRAKRQTSGSGIPVIHGIFEFANDGNRYATVHYSGDSSPVILVLTYQLRGQYNVIESNLYRSANYGQSFVKIDNQLDGTDNNILLWYQFHVGNVDKNVVVFAHASQPKVYISSNEGATWRMHTFSNTNIEGRTLVWNTVKDSWALAQDTTNNVLYLTQDLGANWIHLAANVDTPSDFVWGDPSFDDPTSVFYNTFDPDDKLRGNYTVGLYMQSSPYQNAKEVDPALGRHDDFLLLGPYIFAQKTTNGIIDLYISYKRAPFNKAMIPSTIAHQNYLVSHIHEMQALVVVEHVNGQYNLYLSDIKGVDFSLSLPDIVIENNQIDLELIKGINGTFIANQYVRFDSFQASDTKRTLITLDNGGNWELVVAPDRYKNGTLVNCDPPLCSLHFLMDSSAYARLGVYSLDSAPGIILAHGTVGNKVSSNPDVYLSRDGGITWEQTLTSSWGITIVDHGGLMVAARDYHQGANTDLMYSCSEGDIWTGFHFISVPVTVYGVITEPGEYTTTVSLYGTTSNHAWKVVTVNFSSIYPRICTSSDFYNWQPWDERTGTDCILGSDVTIERRIPSSCCLIGTDYTRTVSVTRCDCTEEDYDCDYGFMHADGFFGPCIRNLAVPYTDPCLTSNVQRYNKSTGYRKIPGDVCTGGVDKQLEPQLYTCCQNDSQPSQPSQPSQQPIVKVYSGVGTAVLGFLFAGTLLIAVIVGVIAVVLGVKHSKLKRRYLLLATSGGSTGGMISFRNEDRTPLHSGNNYNDDDDEPLTL